MRNGVSGRAASLAGFVAITVSVALCNMAAAADYPSRSIDLYIGSAPAGSTDALGRVLARSLERQLGQPVVVHNTPGAGGAVMATQLTHEPPDGYSLGMTISHAYTGNPVVTPSATHYRVGDFTHLASVSKGQCALVTRADSPFSGIEDLVEAARRGEDPVFASQSPLTKILPDYIAKVANVNFRVITVQGGGEIMQTILGGHADFGFSGGPHIDHVAAGQMRVLASAEEARLASSPDAPTLKELGYDIAACSLFVVSAPPKLPDDVKQVLASALEGAIQSAEMKSLIQNLKFPQYFLGPDEVTRALRQEADTLARAVARINTAQGNSGELSPAFMPYVAALLGGVALLVLWVRRFAARANVTGPARFSPASWMFAGAASAVLVLTFVTMSAFGYLPGAAVIVAGFMALARADAKIVLGAAIVYPLVLWLLFDRLLGFPLP